MQCIFCKHDSSGSHSREHIVAESLGNTTAILPPGVVCDSCNNYFSREVEGPFLNSPAILGLRFQQVLPSKRGRVPPQEGLIDSRFPAIVVRYPKGPFVGSVFTDLEGAHHILSHSQGTIEFPGGGSPPRDLVVSRFLAKAALETVAQRCMVAPGGQDYVVDEAQFDPIRRHAREGWPQSWPYHVRRIYRADRCITDSQGKPVQTVHERTILQTPFADFYFVLAIFGLELVINLGGAEITGYQQWLNATGGASPLDYQGS